MKSEATLDLWARLDGLRADLIDRSENYARLTLPYLMTPEGQKADDDGAAKDWQAVGALAVNNLSTRLMLTLFAPSRPFIRLDATEVLLAKAATAGLKEVDVKTLLANAEREAVKVMDRKALRPKLFEALKHLIVLGNVLMILDRQRSILRVVGLKNYVVKRDLQGRLHTCIMREVVPFDELDDNVREIPEVAVLGTGKQDNDVQFFIRIERDGEKYTVRQAVETVELGGAFTTSYTEEDLPYRVLTWTLPDEANYGLGLVGECEGDFESLSTLSRAMIEGAILASEYRWLLNPSSQARPEDFKNSDNGSVLPGMEGDLTLVQAAAEVAGALKIQESIAATYVTRIGRAFLLSSAVTRDAERVTAEEIRLLASELEAGLGGAYSRLAVDLQHPLGRYLLREVKLVIKDEEVTATIVTGLDALSRNGDLEALKRWLDAIIKLQSMPPETLAPLDLDVIYLDLGIGEGLDAKKYLKSAARQAQDAQARSAQEVATATATAAGENAAQGAPQA